MQFLIDTHTMLWWSLGDERLPPFARALIEDPGNGGVVSMASIWEVAIKSSLGRGLPSGITAASYLDLVSEAGFTILDIRNAHVLGVERLEHKHGDPFDRMMIAQAKAEGLVLLTHDQALAAYGDCVMLV